MNISCTYIFANKYDKLVNQAFELVKKTILLSVKEINENQELGIKQDNELMDINRYYFLINYMIYVRRAIDNFIETKESNCITEEELQQFKDVYKIQCIIESGVCNQYTNNIVNIFLNVPSCNTNIVYKWLAYDACTEINGEIFAIATSLGVFRNDNLVEVIQVPKELTLDEFATLLEQTTVNVENLYNDRFLEATPTLCCNEPFLNTPMLEATQIEEDTATIFISGGNSPFYTATLENLTDGELFPEFTVSFGEIILPNLIPDRDYRFKIEASNCKNAVEAEIFFSTKPIIVTVYVDDIIQEEITLDVIVGDVGNIVPYGSTFTIRFEDLVFPFFAVTTVLADGLNVSNTIAYTNPLKTIGVVSFPYVTKSFRVDLSAIAACETTIEYWEVE